MSSAPSGGRQAVIGLGLLAAVLVLIALVSSTSNRGLRVDVLSARRAEPGDTVAVSVAVRDTKGGVTSLSIDFGDGRVETPAIEPQPCTVPLSREFVFSHVYDFTGYATVATSVVTGGCDAATEKVDAIRTVQIRAVRR